MIAAILTKESLEDCLRALRDYSSCTAYWTIVRDTKSMVGALKNLDIIVVTANNENQLEVSVFSEFINLVTDKYLNSKGYTNKDYDASRDTYSNNITIGLHIRTAEREREREAAIEESMAISKNSAKNGKGIYVDVKDKKYSWFGSIADHPLAKKIDSNKLLVMKEAKKIVLGDYIVRRKKKHYSSLFESEIIYWPKEAKKLLSTTKKVYKNVPAYLLDNLYLSIVRSLRRHGIHFINSRFFLKQDLIAQVKAIMELLSNTKHRWVNKEVKSWMESIVLYDTKEYSTKELIKRCRKVKNIHSEEAKPLMFYVAKVQIPKILRDLKKKK